MSSELAKFSVDLLPFIQRRREYEVQRAAKARKRKKLKTIEPRFPSVNTMYGYNRFTKRRFLSDEGRLYKEYIASVLDELPTSAIIERTKHWHLYDVSYVFFMTHEMMYNKNGEIAEHDVSNFLKATEDALFEWLLESDATVMDVHGHKRLTVNEPKLVVLISESGDGDPIYHRGLALDPYTLETDERLV